MTPSEAGADARNLLRANAELFGECAPRYPSRSADGENIGLGKFGERVFCALLLSTPAPALRIHVGYVFGLASKEQMLGVDAGRIVAAMANARPFRDRAMVKSVADAMRPQRFAIDADMSVAIAAF